MVNGWSGNFQSVWYRKFKRDIKSSTFWRSLTKTESASWINNYLIIKNQDASYLLFNISYITHKPTTWGFHVASGDKFTRNEKFPSPVRDVTGRWVRSVPTLSAVSRRIDSTSTLSAKPSWFICTSSSGERRVVSFLGLPERESGAGWRISSITRVPAAAPWRNWRLVILLNSWSGRVELARFHIVSWNDRLWICTFLLRTSSSRARRTVTHYIAFVYASCFWNFWNQNRCCLEPNPLLRVELNYYRSNTYFTDNHPTHVRRYIFHHYVSPLHVYLSDICV